MKSIHKEKVVKPPSTAQLTEIASQLGYDLGTAEIQEYKGQYLFVKLIQDSIRQRRTNSLISNALSVSLSQHIAFYFASA